MKADNEKSRADRRGSSGLPPISPERRRLVDAAREAWIKKLIDLSRRNNLLFYRDLQAGTLDVSTAPPEAILTLLQSSRENAAGVPLSRLVPDRSEHSGSSARIREIAARAQVNLEERGLDTLFLGLGVASWPQDDGGRPAEAPVLLVPLAAVPSGRESRNWTLRRTGDLRVNDVLLFALQVQHGITLDGDALIGDVQGDEEGEPFDLEPLFAHIRRSARAVSGFAITHRYVISNFHFQKLAIVRDLREYADQLAAHDVIAGIAGAHDARESARGGRDLDNLRLLDDVPPEEEFLIRDADASQQRAIHLAVSGANGVISGPPGTGKSQTIANLVAELSARGRTVLFVAEKRAALDVVLERLREVGLDHLCLDLHGADLSRKVVARQLKGSLDIIRTVTSVDVTSLHRRYAERREKLNEHVRRVHTPTPGSTLSVYQLMGRLERLPSESQTEVRWTGRRLSAIDSSKAEEAATVLQELATGYSTLVTGDDPSAWTGAAITDASTAQVANQRATRVAQHWPAFLNALQAAESQNGVKAPKRLRDVQKLLAGFEDVTRVLAQYPPEVFQLDLGAMQTILRNGKTRWGAAWSLCTSAVFRRCRKELINLRYAGSTAVRQLLAELRQLQTTADAWARIAQPNVRPHPISGAEPLRARFQELLPDLKGVLKLFPDKEWRDADLDGLSLRIPQLAADVTTPYRIVHVHNRLQQLAAIDGGRTIADIVARRPRPEHWPGIFRYAWLRSHLEAAWQVNPELAAFSGRAHDAVVNEFRELDREHLELGVARVRRAHAERAIAARNQHRDQDGVVSREAEKKTRHLPLRRLLGAAPDILLAVRPCWMASPLSVSQLIPGDRQYFDLVIFDEASQVLPEDAVTALLRGRRAVVAGDQRQLPPTTFFAAGSDEDGQGDDEVGGFESILDQMSAFLEPAWTLEWHYRSRDEALIAFSNHHIYNDRLVTFPGAGGDPVIHHHVAPFIAAPGDESPSAEVDLVVKLVLEHAVSRPRDTLGVIAMGIRHAKRVEAALDQARRNRADLDEFFDSQRRERFFVKNLERVQGDERDAIILTIGYGKDASGRLLYRFGPLLSQGGERRLNVAVTRARKRIDVVSSFTHFDMEPGRSTAKGVELLRAYLEYAASRGKEFRSLRVEPVLPNDFEQSVCDALTTAGLRVIPQVGTSRYRIDLVAMHPDRPGMPVLAIECDGASYHSAPTARERDRLRQQHLEALGWVFHRIWSTDWFLRRQEEIDRTLRAFENALRRVEGDAPVTPKKAVEGGGVDCVHSPTGSRSPQPVPAGRGPISTYSDRELRAMVRWVRDHENLTDDETVRSVAAALGYERLGSRIEEAIRDAIRKTRL